MRCLAALLLASASADETQLAVLTVHHRPASDLVAVIEPLVGPEGSVAAMEIRLIVRAAPRELEAIRSLVSSLDVAPRSLWITVRQLSTGSYDATRAGVEASLPAAGTTVRVSPGGATTTTTTERRRSLVGGSIGSASDHDAASDVQRVRCLEGRPAYIRVGRAEPLPQAAVVPGSVYAEADVGFWVLPRLAGDAVSLELGATRDSFETGGTIRLRRSHSSVSGRIGEWIPLAASKISSEDEQHTLASRASGRSTSHWSVELRVEAADAP